jgi:hypothetical protein
MRVVMSITPIFRFNRIAWGAVYDNRPRGVIAAGMENGELALWDPAKILAGAEYVKLYNLSIDKVNLRSQRIRIPYSQKYHTHWPRPWA